MVSVSPRRAADDEVVEGRDRIGLRPQADAAGGQARVAVVQVERAVEPGLHVIADGDHTHGVPLSERRRLHGRRGELTTTAIVDVETEVVLQRVGAHHVVSALGEAEHDATGRILTAGDRLELQCHVDVAVRGGRGVDVELVARRALHEDLRPARRAGHLLDCPLPGHGGPAVDALGVEVERLRRHAVGQLQLHRRRPEIRVAACEGDHRGENGLEPPPPAHARSSYTAARCVCGRNAHTRFRAASNDSVWAPLSVGTVSRRRSTPVSNTSISPGSPIATYRRPRAALKKTTSGTPAIGWRSTTFPESASTAARTPPSHAQYRRRPATSMSRPCGPAAGMLTTRRMRTGSAESITTMHGGSAMLIWKASVTGSYTAQRVRP